MVVIFVSGWSLNCSANSISPLELDLMALIPNLFAFASEFMSSNSHFRRGVILSTLITS